MGSAPSNYPRPNGAVCPQCSASPAKEIKYTWWGGLLGPKMMHLHKCQSCGFQFNAQTGKATKNAIIAYNLVVLGVAFIAGLLFMLMKGS